MGFQNQINTTSIMYEVMKRTHSPPTDVKRNRGIFNKYREDDVYLKDDLEKQEYVLSDSTIVYCGNENRIGETGWNLGQFEDGILQICLTILQKQTTVNLPLLCDPKQVSRVCSAMINSNDDNGVLVGNWSGKYADGNSPLSWTGSVEILRKWSASGPVRYGQCWVFAGVLCTVLRCLGIPNRIVTNFTSAHDTDETLSVDTYYDPAGKDLGGKDSVWNFHVWNEAWFTRDDLGSFYNGWQVLDATPQETSEGVYRLGPTSVKAIKQGDVKLKYDGPFVFSEVNADRVSWIYKKEEGSYERVQTNSSSIGKCTSTKAVGSNKRTDITSHYKYAEGSAAEREAYHNAVLQLYGRRSFDEDDDDTSSEGAPAALVRVARMELFTNVNMSGKFTESDPTVIGHNVNLVLVLKNSGAAKNLTINFSVSSSGYTRRVVRNVMSDSMSISMAANQEKEIPFTIPYSRYADCLMEDKVLEVSALCQGDDVQKLLITKVITIQSPSLTIKVLDKAFLNKPLKAEITIVNPLSEALSECVLRAEGSGLIKERMELRFSMKSNKETTVWVEFTPYTAGAKQLQVMVNNEKMMDIKGFAAINVEE
ncbi:protein-glutamine gamma-glutamyltransferase 6-like [Dendropsophus ebraccatus]|uniref:protein-glutamine gamma-glutamyltransferase 6-like n=1 Tax=Dendropsophus ebraccatus TaxID=150705 RepID=UPI00383160D7